MSDLRSTEAPARLRLGLAGFGAAARMVLQSLVTWGNFDLVGAADNDPVVREAFTAQWGLPAYNSLDELIERGRADALYIATPTKFHEDMTIYALEKGLHVLVEKPMALTLESGLAMIATAKRNGRLLLENHKRSVDRPIIAMWKLVDAGLLGDVRAVHRWHFSSWFYRPRAEEELDPTTGGIVLRQGAHEFDIIRLLAQSKPVKVWGWTGDYDPTRPGEGSYQANVEFENGVRATSIYSGYDHFDTEEFTSGLIAPDRVGKTWRASLERRTGVDEAEVKRRTIEPATADTAQRQDSNLFGFTLLNGSLADARPAPGANVLLYGRAGRSEFRLDGPSGTDLIAREFYEGIVNGAPLIHDGNWGLAVLELCLAVRRSAESGGGAVELEHQYVLPPSTISRVIGARSPIEI